MVLNVKSCFMVFSHIFRICWVFKNSVQHHRVIVVATAEAPRVNKYVGGSCVFSSYLYLRHLFIIITNFFFFFDR